MNKETKSGENLGHGGVNGDDTVSIHIGKENYKSINPTTGAALYLLGNIDAAAYDLYREVHGKGDDELIMNTGAVVNLKNGDHFFTVQKNLNPGA